jgi:hypothetical protein
MSLVDAAKHDLLATDVAMTVPDDFPLGTYTVEGKIKDLAGNETTVTLKLIVAGDRTAPTLDITGATADGSAMGGDLATGYILNTTNNPAAADHLIQFKSTTTASEALADDYFGLKLIASTVSAADLKAYYLARGVPEPYLTYLYAAADGTNPFVYIKGTTVKLVDAAKHDIQSTDVDMTVPDNYPLGTYTVQGKIRDLAGNETTVTLKLIILGSQSISLMEGWNLVSFPLQPASTVITDVLSSLDGNYDLVYAWDASGGHSGAGNWMRYAPGIPGNTLETLDETQGFWIRMKSEDILEITGTAPTTTNISLVNSASAGGWNLVGYPSDENHSMPEALEAHGVTVYSLVYAYHADDADTWKRYAPGVPGNDLLELAPAWAYWIKVGTTSTWDVEY